MKRFAHSLAWLTLSEVIFNIAAYVVHSVVGRILGPAEYGRYGLVVTLTTMVIVLIGNGIPTAMSKYLSESLEQHPERIAAIRRKAALLQCALIGAITVLFFLLSPVFATLLRDPSLTPLFRLSSLIIPAFSAASFYHHYFTGLHLFKLQAIVKIVRSFARVGFITLTAVFFGLEGAVSGYILAPLCTFGAAVLIDTLYIRRSIGLGTNHAAPGVHFSGKTILAYAGPLTLFLVFYELVLTLDLYFVKALLQDDHLTGLYNAAITVGRIPYYLFAALAMILLPAISKTTAERKHDETERLVNQSLRLMTLLLCPMITLIVLYGDPLLRFFYGNRFDGAATTLSVFAVGVGFLTVFYVLSFALNGAGLVKIPMRLTLFGCFGLAILTFLLIPAYGIVGAALSTSLVSFLLMLGVLYSTERHFRVRIAPRTIMVSLAGIALVSLLARLLPAGTFSFLFSGTALFILYFGFLFVTGEIHERDFRPLRNSLHSQKKPALDSDLTGS